MELHRGAWWFWNAVRRLTVEDALPFGLVRRQEEAISHILGPLSVSLENSYHEERSREIEALQCKLLKSGEQYCVPA